ncbi:MAG: type-F conjugative transfer system pilin assembly protein TrbC [Pseudomonadales bacterium]|nr:type-F conjugative transfer system pilin assembly protein TrbC [Pseudomonadales bacterium]
MLRSLKTILCGLLLSSLALLVIADEVKKYQEPTQAEKNTAKERITEQLEEAEAITQDADYQKNTARAIQQAKTMAMPNSMPIVNVRDEDVSAKNAIDIDKLSAAHAQQSIEENRMTPLVLVSLSMPEQTLKGLTTEAGRLGGSIAFRGAKEDSVMKMRNEFARIGIEGQIDPSFFRRFSVDEVPTFIMPLEPIKLCDSDHCPMSRHVKVSGLVSIETALEFISRNSKEPDAKAIAEQWLDKLRNTSSW